MDGAEGLLEFDLVFVSVSVCICILWCIYEHFEL